MKLFEVFIFGITIIVWNFHFYYNHRIKMNLEETKKIIENKIEAEALTRNVRSQTKSYIDQNKI